MAEKVETLGGNKRKETVRIVVQDSAGNILLLKKDKSSKAKGLCEYPGGNIENIIGLISTRKEQIEAAIAELFQETGLTIAPESLAFDETFDYSFQYNNKEVDRRVHRYKTTLLGTKPKVKLNSLPEDKHSGYLWVSKSKLEKMHRLGRLSGNTTPATY